MSQLPRVQKVCAQRSFHFRFNTAFARDEFINSKRLGHTALFTFEKRRS